MTNPKSLAQPLRSLIACAIILCLGSAASSFAAPSPAKRPNILWLIGENMGPDLGCYGTAQVRTPALDRLAAEGMRFTRAFSTAPVCSTSRSALMTGMYQTSIGAHHHRSHRTAGLDDGFGLPAHVRPVTHWLSDVGYVTANVDKLAGEVIGTGKTDLNYTVEGAALRKVEPLEAGATDVMRHDLANSQRLFHLTEWNDLKGRQPFFAQVNFQNVERHGATAYRWANQDTNPRIADPAKVALPPYYPDTPALRADWTGYLDSVSGLDGSVGRVLQRLEADGLADDTIVIFFGDNGRLEARGLDWCYDSGLHVPLIIRWPRNFPAPAGYEAGATSDRLVSLIDVTATTLEMAGVTPPKKVQGRAFFGDDRASAPRYVFGARDRTDNAINHTRTVRSERYRYIRNFMPEKSFLTRHTYKLAYFPYYREIEAWLKEGKPLTPAQATLVQPRLPEEELYDVAADPYEVVNLATSKDPAHQAALREMRAALEQWMKETGDQGHIPEDPAVFEVWNDYAERTHGRHLK